jgi:hypothetical protein
MLFAPILCNLHNELWKILKALVAKIGGQVQYCEQYAADLVLLGEEEAVLQGMNERLIATGRCYGMEMKVEKS